VLVTRIVLEQGRAIGVEIVLTDQAARQKSCTPSGGDRLVRRHRLAKAVMQSALVRPII